MNKTILGSGGCGFLRVYNHLTKSGQSVAYKGGRVKFQNSFQTWDSRTGLIWDSELLSPEDRKTRAATYLASVHQEINISHIPIKYVKEILELDPTHQFVCIQGDFEKTVKSLFIHWGYRNPCFTERGIYRTRYVLQQFPDYSDLECGIDATRSYVKDYWHETKQLAEMHPNNFKVMTCGEFTGESTPTETAPATITTTLHGGLGNNLFQMAEVIAFCAENKLKSPEFGTWSLIGGGGLYPPTYNADHFLGRHTGTHDQFMETFPNIDWIKEQKPTFDTKFMINDMFSFSVVHHQRESILKAFSPSDKLIRFINENYKNVFSKQTVSLHLRTCTLAADDHVVTVPFEFHKKALSSFEDDVVVLVFSDNNELAKNYIRELKLVSNKQFNLIEENQFTSIFIMAKCNHHILHVSTMSFWGAYLSPCWGQPQGLTIYHKSFETNHTNQMISKELNWVCYE